jgi:hypothetical protein
MQNLRLLLLDCAVGARAVTSELCSATRGNLAACGPERSTMETGAPLLCPAKAPRRSHKQVRAVLLSAFRLLGTPENQKRYVLFDAGHVLLQQHDMKETLGWFDRYLCATGKSQPGS